MSLFTCVPVDLAMGVAEDEGFSARTSLDVQYRRQSVSSGFAYELRICHSEVSTINRHLAQQSGLLYQ